MGMEYTTIANDLWTINRNLFTNLLIIRKNPVKFDLKFNLTDGFVSHTRNDFICAVSSVGTDMNKNEYSYFLRDTTVTMDRDCVKS